MSDVKKRLTGQLAVWAIQLLGHMPLGLNRALGSLVGYFSYTFNSRLCQVTRTNLQHCFSHLTGAEREALVRDSMIQTGQSGTELSLPWCKPDHWLQSKIIETQNRELFEQALAADSGTVFLVPHLGNWEIFGIIFSPVNNMVALYQPPKLEALEALIRKARERHGAKLVPTNRKGVMTLFKNLKEGGGTFMLPDQVPAEEAGKFAPFYGVSALTMTLVHGLIQRTGCRVIMTYALRVPGGFKIVFKEPD